MQLNTSILLIIINIFSFLRIDKKKKEFDNMKNYAIDNSNGDLMVFIVCLTMAKLSEV